MSDALLQTIAELLQQGSPVAPILALAAGVIVSLTPCSLSSVPLIVGYMQANGEASTKRAFGISVLFALGSALTFTGLGIAASLAGRLVTGANSIWYILLGILMVLMALQTWEVIEIIPSTYLASKNKTQGFIGAFIAGILAGIFSSPCSTPVLVALLTLVASSGNIAWGAFLLLLYGIGHGVLAVAAGTSVNFTHKIARSNAYGKVNTIIRALLGTAILALGLYMLYLGF